LRARFAARDSEMPSRKQDYLLRLIEELGQLMTEIVKLRKHGSLDTALQTLLQAQERLFARPSQEFMTRPVEEQLHLLVVGETAADAREKCLMYAALLTEAGHIYAAREQTAVASGAYQFALHVLLFNALRHPAADEVSDRALIATALDLLPGEQLALDVKRMLEEFRANTPRQQGSAENGSGSH
jgi:hypothetical protein